MQYDGEKQREGGGLLIENVAFCFLQSCLVFLNRIQLSKSVMLDDRVILFINNVIYRHVTIPRVIT